MNRWLWSWLFTLLPYSKHALFLISEPAGNHLLSLQCYSTRGRNLNYFFYKGHLLLIQCYCRRKTKLFFLEVGEGHLLLIQCYCRRKTKLTLFILDYSISSKLFFLEVQSSFIDPVLLLQEAETNTKLTLFILDSSICSELFSLEVQ